MNISKIVLSSVIFNALIILSIMLASAQTYNESKTINRLFNVRSTSTLDINNKYGKIQITNWKKDSIQISVYVEVESKDKKKLNDLLDNVNFEFNATHYYIIVNTFFESDKNFFSDIGKITKMFTSTESQIRVDYNIKAPDYINFKIRNKYGDVYIEEIKGNFDLELSNGNVKIESLKGKSKIECKFCDRVNIKKINLADIDIHYSELNIDTATQLNIISKSSDIFILKTDVIKINSKRDKYDIENANYVYGETYFSDIEIENLVNESSMNLKYGELKVQNMSSGFSLLNFTGKLTDLSLYISEKSSYQIDINGEDAFFDLPYKSASIQEKELPNDKKMIFGNYGSVNSKSKLSVSIEGGSLTIRHK